MSKAHAASLVTLALAIGAAGCLPSEEVSEDRAIEVTAIPQTPVELQPIGNCWIYGTLAWAESLHASATGAAIDLAENWITYWAWFEQVFRAGLLTAPSGPDEINDGGNVPKAFELMGRYGLAEEAGFPSASAADAIRSINVELSAGELATLGARRDPVRVRRALDRAFGLAPETIAAMEASFEADGRRRAVGTPTTAAAATLRLRRADELVVRLPHPETHVAETRTLADAIGAGDRRYAWRVVASSALTGDRRWLQRIQRALHDGYPLPLSWYVDWAGREADGITFSSPTSGAFGAQRGGGWHLSLLTDYEAADVPGFGTLPAGRVERRADALEAALDNRATVSMLRVKNSWGEVGSSADPSKLAGYSDLMRSYYARRVPGTLLEVAGRVTLPAGY